MINMPWAVLWSYYLRTDVEYKFFDLFTYSIEIRTFPLYVIETPCARIP